MSKPIQDEFSALPISRQRRWQLRRQRDGCCVTCGAPQAASIKCRDHNLKNREYQRKVFKYDRRYLGAQSYSRESLAMLWLWDR